MSEKTVTREVITLDAIGPFGVLVGTTWYNADEKIRGGMKKGGTYNVAVSLYTTKTGKEKKTIEEVLDGQSVAAVKAVANPLVKAATKAPAVSPAKEEVRGGRDFDAEARGKIRSLFLEAAMPTLLNGVDVADDAAVKALMNKWVEFAMLGK